MAVSVMKREKVRLNRGLLLTISAAMAITAAPVGAQGIGEYGGVLGMPKPMPTGHAGALQNLYGAGSLDKVTGGQSAGAGAGMPLVGDSRVIAKNVADKANAYFNEAQKKEKAGKLAEAEMLYRSSAAWRERVWGTKDPAVYVIYGKIGALCTKQNKHSESEAAYRRQIACSVRLYGAGAYESCPVLSHLAEACMAQSKLPEAISTYRQLYQLKKRKLGDTNAETLGSMLKLAGALKQNGNTAEADAMAKEGAKLAQASPENALLVQAFNEVVNPPAATSTPADAAQPAAATEASITPATAAPKAAPGEAVSPPPVVSPEKSVEKSPDAKKEK